MNERDDVKPAEPGEPPPPTNVELTDAELEPVSGGAGRTRGGTPDDSI